MPRKRPAVIVAPEREVPGTRARAWARPTQIASAGVTSVERPGACGPPSRRPSGSGRARSATTPIRYRLRAPFSIWSLNASPKTPIGIVAMMMYQPIRASSSPRSSGRRRLAQPDPGDPHEVAPEEDDHRQHRPELDDGGEERPGILPAGEGGDDAQMGGARDRQELGEPLRDAEDDRFEPGHEDRPLGHGPDPVRHGSVTPSTSTGCRVSRRAPRSRARRSGARSSSA